MTSWTPEQLAAIGNAGELDIAALRPDGTLRPYTTIWVFRVGDGLYVRSTGGRTGPGTRRCSSGPKAASAPAAPSTTPPSSAKPASRRTRSTPPTAASTAAMAPATSTR